MNFPLILNGTKACLKDINWSNFNTHLNDIKLLSDHITDFQNFWDSISYTLMSTLGSTNELKEYKDLMINYEPFSYLVPPPTNYNDTEIIKYQKKHDIWKNTKNVSLQWCLHYK